MITPTQSWILVLQPPGWMSWITISPLSKSQIIHFLNKIIVFIQYYFVQLKEMNIKQLIANT